MAHNDGGPVVDMTLRDWFAGKALVGLIAGLSVDVLGGSENDSGLVPPHKDAALLAGKYADAMLAERKENSDA